MREWLVLSLQVAAWATLFTGLSGAALAWILARRCFPGKALIEGISLLPLVMPPTVLGYYLLVTLGAESWLGRAYRRAFDADLAFSFNGIVIAAVVSSFPLFVRQAQVAFAEVDRDLEDSARSMGAGEWEVLRHITLPLARRGLIAGTVLAFARALGDFGATLMVGGSIPGATRTLSLAVYDSWQAGDSATAGALALLLAAAAFLTSLLATRLSTPPG
jgi:molybdate transport system permease protein